MPDREWVDAHGTKWRLCDRCDSPFQDGAQFWAPVREGSDYLSLEYCHGCAQQTVKEWAPRLNDHPVDHAPQDCWCGDPMCGEVE